MFFLMFEPGGNFWPPQIQRGESTEQKSMDSDRYAAARKFWRCFRDSPSFSGHLEIATRCESNFRGFPASGTALHWLFCTRKLTFDQNGKLEVEKPCYFFAVKWDFDKMGLLDENACSLLQNGIPFHRERTVHPPYRPWERLQRS